MSEFIKELTPEYLDDVLIIQYGGWAFMKCIC